MSKLKAKPQKIIPWNPQNPLKYDYEHSKCRRLRRGLNRMNLRITTLTISTIQRARSQAESSWQELISWARITMGSWLWLLLRTAMVIIKDYYHASLFIPLAKLIATRNLLTLQWTKLLKMFSFHNECFKYIIQNVLFQNWWDKKSI